MKERDMKRTGAEGSMGNGCSRIMAIYAAQAMDGPDAETITMNIIKNC